MFANIISYAYDFNIIVNGALVRELEGTACAYRCWEPRKTRAAERKHGHAAERPQHVHVERQVPEALVGEVALLDLSGNDLMSQKVTPHEKRAYLHQFPDWLG